MNIYNQNSNPYPFPEIFTCAMMMQMSKQRPANSATAVSTLLAAAAIEPAEVPMYNYY